MNLNRLDTEGISRFQYQVIRNDGHEGLTRSQRNPAHTVPSGIYDVPNLVPPVRRPAHPQEIVRAAQELQYRWEVSGKVNSAPCFSSQGLEYPLPEDFVGDGVLKPELPVLRSDLETIVKGQRNHRPQDTVEIQNPDS